MLQFNNYNLFLKKFKLKLLKLFIYNIFMSRGGV